MSLHTAPPVACSVTGIHFRRNAADVAQRTRGIVSDFEKAVDAIALADGSYEQTVLALAQATDRVALLSSEITLPALVAASAEDRGAGAEAKKALAAMFSRAHARQDVYQKLQQGMINAASPSLERVGRKHLRLFEATGLAVFGSGDRERVATLQAELQQLCQAFEQRINEDASTLLLSRNDLDGLPDAFLDALEEEDGFYKVGLKAPTLTPVLQMAKDPETRRRAYAAAANRCKDNVPRLERIVGLRREVAELLGFEHHAASALSNKMAGTLSTCDSFLDRCFAALKPRRDEDSRALLKLKVADFTEKEYEAHLRRCFIDGLEPRALNPEVMAACALTGASEAGGLRPWDVAFYSRKLKESLGIDDAALKPFFKAETVVPAAVQLVGRMLGIDAKKCESVGLWHESCELYELRDAANGTVVGHVVLDLFARPGKFGHQMVVPLRPRGCGATPVCAVLGNLGDESRNFRLKEVETLLHELGHVYHALCGIEDHAVTSWAWPMVTWPGGVEMDFLELPSMLVQQWAYSPAALEVLSKHQATGEPLPQQTIQALAANRHLLCGQQNARYIAMCKYDLAMHTAGAGDVVGMWPAIYAKYSGLEEHPETHFVSTWYHMAIGYDAAYYGYLWSEIYAVDCYTRFGDRVDDFALGAHLRRTILEPGATRDASVMISDFLGRAPSEKAYFDRLTASTPTEKKCARSE